MSSVLPRLADGLARVSARYVPDSFTIACLLTLVTFAMGSGAAFGRSRPAAIALIVIGAVVLGISLLSDLPASDDAGLIGRDYAEATASAGTGLWLEVTGGLFAVLAGLLRVIRPDD